MSRRTPVQLVCGAVDWLQNLVLRNVLSRLDTVTRFAEMNSARITQLENTMSELSDKLDIINEASNREAQATQELATVVANLRDQIQNGQLPSDAAQRLDDIATALNQRADFLTNLAADPANPVPDQPPTDQPV